MFLVFSMATSKGKPLFRQSEVIFVKDMLFALLALVSAIIAAFSFYTYTNSNDNNTDSDDDMIMTTIVITVA